MRPASMAPSSAPTTPSKTPGKGDMTITPRAHTPHTPRTPRTPQSGHFIMGERRKEGDSTEGSPKKHLIREMTLVEQSPNGKGTRIRVELIRADAGVTPKKIVSRPGTPMKRLESPLKDAAGHVSQGVDVSPSRSPASTRRTAVRTEAPVGRAGTSLNDMDRETPRKMDGSPPKTLISTRKTTTSRTDMTIESSASPLKGTVRAIPRKTHTDKNPSKPPYRITPVAVKSQGRVAGPRTPAVISTTVVPKAMKKTSVEKTATISYTPVNSPSRPASPAQGTSPAKQKSSKMHSPSKEAAMDEVSPTKGVSFTPKTMPPVPLAMDGKHDGIAVRDFALMLDHARSITDTPELSPNSLGVGETDKLMTMKCSGLSRSPRRTSLANRRTSSGTHSGTRDLMESEMDQMRAKMGHLVGSLTDSTSTGSPGAANGELKEDIRTKLSKHNRSDRANHTPTPPINASKEARAFSPGAHLSSKTVSGRPLGALAEKKNWGLPRGPNAAGKRTAPAVPGQDHPATVDRPRNPTPHAATGVRRQRGTFARTTRLTLFDLSPAETPKKILSVKPSSTPEFLSTTAPGLCNVSQSSLRRSVSSSTLMVPGKDIPPKGSSPASDGITKFIHHRKPTSIDSPTSRTRWPSKIPVHVMNTATFMPRRNDERFADAQDISNLIKDFNEDDRARAALLDSSPSSHITILLKKSPLDPKPADRVRPLARKQGEEEYLFSSDFNANIRVRDKKTTPSPLNVNISLANEDKQSKKEVNVTPITAHPRHHYESPTIASVMRLTPASVSSISPQDPFFCQQTPRLFPSPSQKLGVATEKKTTSLLTPRDVTMQMRSAGFTTNMTCTPSKKISKSLAKAIDLKIAEDARAGKEFTASGNRISDLMNRRVGSNGK